MSSPEPALPTSGRGGPRVCPSCGARYDATARFCLVDRAPLQDEGATTDDTLVSSMVAEKYYVDRKLGEGGMGRVYLASQLPMNRSVALKVMRADALGIPDARARFTREARAMSVVAHPNIVQIYDSGETGEGLPYIAMEYIEGEPLNVTLARERTLPLRRAASILLQTAGALDAAHQRGIVHRDLKPENILLARTRDGDDHVKVVDFGIARPIQQDSLGITSTGLILGTPAYMSPEQLTGDRVDAPSDVYALALMTCVMLTGLLPFPSLQQDLGVRLTRPPSPLAALAPQLAWPEAAQALLNQALAVDPAQRFQSTLEFAVPFVDALAAGHPGDFGIAPFVPGISVRPTPTGKGPAVTTGTFPAATVQGAPVHPSPGRAHRTRALAGALIGTTTLAIAALWMRTTSATPAPATPGDSTVASASVPDIPAPAATPRQAPPPRQGAPRAGAALPATRQESLATPTPDSGTATSTPAVATPDTQPPAPAPTAAPAPATPPPPSEGWVAIGTRTDAVLYVDGELRGPVPSLRYFRFPAGRTVQLRLHAEGCQDWDTVLTIRTDTARVGYKRPRC